MQKSLLYRYTIYQRERFPLAILVFTTLAVLLSSAAILYYNVTFIQMIVTFFAVLAYLFHMRVIDEKRDFNHDSQHHKSRPIQQGVITIEELEKINIFGLMLFAMVAVAYGFSSIVIAVITLIYTYLAGNDFYMGEKIRKKFFFYNGMNMIQMILLQLFIYAVFTKSLNINYTMWLHLFFVLTNTTIMEVVRKIKIKSEESSGYDTYSGRIGFNKSLIIFLLLTMFNYLLFLGLLYSLSRGFAIYLGISSPLILFLFISLLLHHRRQAKMSEKVLMLSTFVLYVGLNFIIYFFNRI